LSGGRWKKPACSAVARGPTAGGGVALASSASASSSRCACTRLRRPVTRRRASGTSGMGAAACVAPLPLLRVPPQSQGGGSCAGMPGWGVWTYARQPRHPPSLERRVRIRGVWVLLPRCPCPFPTQVRHSLQRRGAALLLHTPTASSTPPLASRLVTRCARSRAPYPSPTRQSAAPRRRLSRTRPQRRTRACAKPSARAATSQSPTPVSASAAPPTHRVGIHADERPEVLYRHTTKPLCPDRALHAS
jgi:hypothetical protein